MEATTTMEQRPKQMWIRLESNPDVNLKYNCYYDMIISFE